MRLTNQQINQNASQQQQGFKTEAVSLPQTYTNSQFNFQKIGSQVPYQSQIQQVPAPAQTFNVTEIQFNQPNSFTFQPTQTRPVSQPPVLIEPSLPAREAIKPYQFNPSTFETSKP
jgi:hypothetical protein